MNIETLSTVKQVGIFLQQLVTSLTTSLYQYPHSGILIYGRKLAKQNLIKRIQKIKKEKEKQGHICNF